MDPKLIRELVDAINRSAEIHALTELARTFAFKCDACGLFATERIETTGNSFFNTPRHICDACPARQTNTTGDPRPISGASAMRRLNALLRRESR